MRASRALVSARDTAQTATGLATGPVASVFTLLFRPLWPIVVPIDAWLGTPDARDHVLPDSLLRPLLIWILDYYPDQKLIARLIEAGDGGGLPDRDVLKEPDWADPVRRAAELLWERAASVLSRTVPDPVLAEMADSSSIRQADIEALLPAVSFVFANAASFFQPPSHVAPLTSEREELIALLRDAAGVGITAWSFALNLLLTSRNEPDFVMPAARSVAYEQGDSRLWLDRCDAAFKNIFTLFENRCERIAREIAIVAPVERRERRVMLWLEPTELATISALIRFANRCSLHVVAAAQLKATVEKAAQAQFRLLVEEDLLLVWPTAGLSDSRMVAFERGNRRLRQLASLGALFSRSSVYQEGCARLMEHYAVSGPGLNYPERMHVIETLETSYAPSRMLLEYLRLMPPPARPKPAPLRQRRRTLNTEPLRSRRALSRGARQT